VAGGMVDYLSVAEVLKVISAYLQLSIQLDDVVSRAKEIEESVKKAIERTAAAEEEKREKEPSTHM